MIEFCSATAMWCHSGKPVVPIRWVLVRDPHGRFSPPGPAVHRSHARSLQIIVVHPALAGRGHLQEARAIWEWRRSGNGPIMPWLAPPPCLLGLFSIVTLLAGQLHHQTRTAVLTDSWYRKSHPTFAACAGGRARQIWRETGLLTSQRRHKTPKPSQALQRC
jgi:hypothetical protein